MRRRLLADEDVDAVVGLLADEGDEAQEQLRVRPHGGKLQEEKMSMESLLTMNIFVIHFPKNESIFCINRVMY